MAAEVVSHTDQSAEQLVVLWNQRLPWDPIDERCFLRKALLDPNFRSNGLWLALDGTEAVGFCLAIVRRVALEHCPSEEPVGYITAFGLLPERRREGIGSRLMEAAEEWLRGEGKAGVAIAPYVPNYFVPGIDETAYLGAAEFLVTRGYRRTGEALGMDCRLITSDPLERLRAAAQRLEADGIAVRPLSSEWLPRFFAFLRAETPPDWSRHARQILTEGAPLSDVTIATDGERVIGYCQSEGSHFGPFGVAAEYRGRGVGTALLSTSLQRMKQRGEHCAWVTWTSDQAAPLYERLGFERTRRFTLFAKELAR